MKFGCSSYKTLSSQLRDYYEFYGEKVAFTPTTKIEKLRRTVCIHTNRRIQQVYHNKKRHNSRVLECREGGTASAVCRNTCKLTNGRLIYSDL